MLTYRKYIRLFTGTEKLFETIGEEDLKFPIINLFIVATILAFSHIYYIFNLANINNWTGWNQAAFTVGVLILIVISYVLLLLGFCLITNIWFWFFYIRKGYMATFKVLSYAVIPFAFSIFLANFLDFTDYIVIQVIQIMILLTGFYYSIIIFTKGTIIVQNVIRKKAWLAIAILPIGVYLLTILLYLIFVYIFYA